MRIDESDVICKLISGIFDDTVATISLSKNIVKNLHSRNSSFKSSSALYSAMTVCG